jgi:voltage-gated potassium channel
MLHSSPMGQHSPPISGLRHRTYVVIFGHDTRAGRLFDIALLWTILLSVGAVILESVHGIGSRYGAPLRALEWAFTVVFTVEYALRLYCSPHRRTYVTSFFGAVDLLAILPTFLSVIVPGAQSLLVIRVLRLLRVFRILKLVQFNGQADVLLRALAASLPKVTVFLGTVLTIVVISGAAMYLVEGPDHGFTNIPEGIYWSIVTVTTVGFGDITPQTPLGRLLAAVLMITGYAIIAVPTGIVASELTRADPSRGAPLTCPHCRGLEHAHDAEYCRKCGAPLKAHD